ncbi:hypothetical protein Br6_04860 [Rhodococcus sp. Br-6]|nr:hypothetical protein Br6_04860 [Rhodococcus sp. Br-6]
MTATITDSRNAPTPTFVAAAARLRMIEIADAAHRLLRARPEDPAPSTWDFTHQRWFDVITAPPGLPDLEGAIDKASLDTLRSAIDQVQFEKDLRVAGRALPRRHVALTIALTRVIEIAKRDILESVHNM